MNDDDNVEKVVSLRDYQTTYDQVAALEAEVVKQKAEIQRLTELADRIAKGKSQQVGAYQTVLETIINALIYEVKHR